MKNNPDDWDSHWDDFASSAEANPAQQMRHSIIKDLISLKTGKGKNILDIGSGQGDLIYGIKKYFGASKMLGFEISSTGVEISQKKIPDVMFIKADVYNPPPELTKYLQWADVAVCSEVLEHVDDPELFIKLSRNYMAPSSTLIITVPGGPMSAFDKHIGHKQHFTYHGIKCILERAGYKNIKIQHIGFPFFNLYRMMVILRGKALISDVQEKNGQISPVAILFMNLFKFLFLFNVNKFPWGWQVVAVAETP